MFFTITEGNHTCVCVTENPNPFVKLKKKVSRKKSGAVCNYIKILETKE